MHCPIRACSIKNKARLVPSFELKLSNFAPFEIFTLKVSNFAPITHVTFYCAKDILTCIPKPVTYEQIYRFHDLWFHLRILTLIEMWIETFLHKRLFCWLNPSFYIQEKPHLDMRFRYLIFLYLDINTKMFFLHSRNIIQCFTVLFLSYFICFKTINMCIIEDAHKHKKKDLSSLPKLQDKH